MLRKTFVIITAAAALIVAGCNTIAGLGRDVQAAGDAVETTAEDVRRN